MSNGCVQLACARFEISTRGPLRQANYRLKSHFLISSHWGCIASTHPADHPPAHPIHPAQLPKPVPALPSPVRDRPSRPTPPHFLPFVCHPAPPCTCRLTIPPHPAIPHLKNDALLCAVAFSRCFRESPPIIDGGFLGENGIRLSTGMYYLPVLVVQFCWDAWLSFACIFSWIAERFFKKHPFSLQNIWNWERISIILKSINPWTFKNNTTFGNNTSLSITQFC